MPYSRKLEEELKTREVVFLYISLDSDEAIWKKTIKKHNLAGIHLLSKGAWDVEIRKKYHVYGIPKYILIDKEGKIKNGNAKRPSKGAKAEIEKLLN